MKPFEQPIRDPEILERMEAAFDLWETSEEIMLQNIRRRHPELNEREVEERFFEWLRQRTKDDSYGRFSEKWANKFRSL